MFNLSSTLIKPPLANAGNKVFNVKYSTSGSISVKSLDCSSFESIL